MKLDEYIKDYKIFIDTCSLLENLRYTENLFETNRDLLLSQGKKIYIPLRVVQEIEKHSKNNRKYMLMRVAGHVYKKLGLWQQQGLVEICGNDQFDNFADNAFLTAFTAMRVHSKLLLITQDRNLSQDILALNNSLSVNGQDIKVLYINRAGKLVQSKGRQEIGTTWQSYSSLRGGIVTSVKPKVDFSSLDMATPKPEEIFASSCQLTSLDDSPIEIRQIPAEGQSVYDEKHTPVKLQKTLAAGGEGIVYATDRELVAKIYKPGKLTKRKQAKLKLLLSKNLSCPGICFPTEALYNGYGEFGGYLMPAAKGHELQRSIFIKGLFQKKFPDWQKTDLIWLTLTILSKFKYLHDRDIIIGDINPGNILVASPKEVYLVDTDSYQVEGFPCPVGTPMFTPVELQGKSYEGYLRSLGNENFAVATLLFMLMVPGKPPYSHQGGESIIDNIRLQKFPYQLGHIKGEQVPEGQWRFIWSHLSYRLKEAFYETFQRRGKYAAESNRLNVDDWLQILKEYYTNLVNGNMLKTDEMSNDLFPTRFKKEKWAVYRPCQVCGNETKKEFGRNYIICYACSQKVHEKRVCAQCGQEFNITVGEKMFLESKGKELPLDCKTCRDKRKNSFGRRFYFR